MRIRLLIVTAIFSSVYLCSAQDSKQLDKTLSLYSEQSERLFSEFRKAIKKTPGNRVLTVTKNLTETTIVDAIRAFNKAWKTSALLLFYFHDGQSLHSFLLDENGVVNENSQTLSADSLLSAEINLRNSLGVYTRLSLDRGVDTRGLGLKPSIKESDTTYLQKIASLLINEQMAVAIEKYSHLLIVPTLNLYSFPFAAIRPFNNANCLGAVIPISIIPNLYEFTSHKFPAELEPFRSGMTNATVLGGAIFNSSLTPQKYYGRNKTIDEFFLEELPFTIEQTNAVKEILLKDSTGRINIEFLQYAKATVSNFLVKGRNADLVYIATHAFSSSLHPWDSSFIAFAKEKVEGKNFWSSRSIINNDFKAKLVVLSACQTGTGQLWETGIISLSSSFYYAGADLIVSTLWNVDDFYTFRFMREFMKGLLDEGTRHPAYYLHLIQKKTKTAPRHWAGFICFGI